MPEAFRASLSAVLDRPFFREIGFNLTSTRTVTRSALSWAINSSASRPSYPMLIKFGEAMSQLCKRTLAFSRMTRLGYSHIRLCEHPMELTSK